MDIIALLNNREGFEMDDIANQCDLVIDPRDLSYIVKEDPIVLHNGKPIELSFLFIRNSTPLKTEVSLAAHVFDLMGTGLVDPVERFGIDYPSKILSTVSRTKRGIGIPTYFAFNKENALHLLKYIQFPLLYKPVSGSSGEGIVKVENEDMYKEMVNYHNYSKPIMFQDFIEIKSEFRVLLYDNKILGITKKSGNGVNSKPILATETQTKAITKFIDNTFFKQGLYGLDLALSKDRWYVIEENRSPQWKLTSQQFNFNIPKEILRLNQIKREEELNNLQARLKQGTITERQLLRIEKLRKQ